MTKEFELAGYNRHEMWYTPEQLSEIKEPESYGSEIYPKPHINIETVKPLEAHSDEEE
jgi:formate hydrogenlyase subunit 6/NADH:ubiquinone oxidoreductase subunit I